MFHLFTYEASRVFVKGNDTIGMLCRSYGHGEMLEVSKRFARGELPKKLHPLFSTLNNPSRNAVFGRLKSIAQSFIDLQEARHEADYDVRKSYSRVEVERLVKIAEKAFADWKIIRNDDLARIYLSCFLVLKSWDRDR